MTVADAFSIFAGGGVLVGGQRQLVHADLAAHVGGDLGRAEQGAVREHRQHVPRQCVRIFGSDPEAGPEVVVPAQQVGGAGQDVQQRPLRQPVMDGGLKGQRLRPAFGALTALQHRPAALEHQVGVRRVSGVDRRGDIGEPAPVVASQRGRLGRDTGLGAERRRPAAGTPPTT